MCDGGVPDDDAEETVVLGSMRVLLCSSLIAWGQVSSHPGTAAAGNGNEAFILVSADNEAGPIRGILGGASPWWLGLLRGEKPMEVRHSASSTPNNDQLGGRVGRIAGDSVSRHTRPDVVSVRSDADDRQAADLMLRRK